MTHPLQAIPRGPARWGALFCFAAATVALGWQMRAIVDGVTPNVVSFELAATSERALQIMQAWGPVGMAAVQNHLRLDNLWLLLYSTTLALLCVMAADSIRAQSASLATLGIALAWGQWLAAVLDRIENTALQKTLTDGATDGLTLLASVCAALKFSLVAAAACYTLTVLIRKAQLKNARVSA